MLDEVLVMEPNSSIYILQFGLWAMVIKMSFYLIFMPYKNKESKKNGAI